MYEYDQYPKNFRRKNNINILTTEMTNVSSQASKVANISPATHANNVNEFYEVLQVKRLVKLSWVFKSPYIIARFFYAFKKKLNSTKCTGVYQLKIILIFNIVIYEYNPKQTHVGPFIYTNPKTYEER